MNRIQNAALVVWVVLLLLFTAFNWQMVWRPVEIVFLFQEFNLPILLWLVLGSIGLAGVLRALSAMGGRSRQKRTDKEIYAIKAKAFDGLTGELDKFVEQLQDKLGDRIQTFLERQAEEKSADGEAPPQLSAETTATLADIKPASDKDETDKAAEEAAEKPKRRWRKKKT